MRNALALAVILSGLVAACGSGSPAAPTEYPQVAGTYTGTLTLSVSQGSDSVTVTGSMRLVVEQSGPHLIISGSMTFFGETTELEPPIVGSIDETGVFTETGSSSEIERDDDCGRFRVTSDTLTFAGSTMELTLTARTDHCGVIRMSATLTRN